MTVIGAVIARDKKFHHKDVHSHLGDEIYCRKHIGLELCALVAPSAIAAGGLVTVLNGLDFLHRNILTVNAREEPAASVLSKVFIHRKKHRTRVITRDYTAVTVAVDIENIVKLALLGIRYVKFKVLHKSETEAVGGFGVIRDFHVAPLGHHHTKIFL